jgi:hypothetical protein
MGTTLAKNRKAAERDGGTGTTAFAIARSHKAAEIAYDLAKSISQTCLVINGGAATAILTFLAKENVAPALYKSITWCLGLYGLGVFASALAMFFIMQTADWWNYFWYWTVYPREADDDTDYQEVADRWHFGFYWAFSVAMGCFLIASGILSYALVTVK